jgi:uncharacterized protein YkwD
MTEEQDVLNPQRRRRHGNTILLGSIPVAVALTALLTAGTWASAPSASLSAEPPIAKVTAPAPMPSIVAPGTVGQVDAAAKVHAIKVILPPAPKVVAKPAASTAKSSASVSKSTASKASGSKASASAKKSTTEKSTTKKSTTKKPAAKKAAAKKVSASSYCANPKSPYAASGGPKALLAAANKERARLGMKKLTWSSSLSSAATKWSKNLAAQDSKTKAPADKLSHNPNRPGAENVAVSYVSTGLNQGGAISRAHKNWMYSSGHCKNIMNPKYSTMGAGAAATKDGTTWYTTENFR